jgi:hypothetical protein
MPLPNFLVLGAARSGTTSLYRYLSQHPAVYLSPVKEPNFFAFAGESTAGRGAGFQRMVSVSVTDPAEYRALFDGVTTETRYGEASTKYLYLPSAVGNIRRYVPDARFVVTLRNPVERAYSQYLLTLRDMKETLTDFGAALEAEPQRIREDWDTSYHYAKRGFYYHQLRRYLDVFSRDQFSITLYDDLRRDPPTLMRVLFRFLGVDENCPVDTQATHHSSRMVRTPRNEFWSTVMVKPSRTRTFLKQMLPTALREPVSQRLHERATFQPPLLPEVRAKLVAGYREDILRLQDLLGRDLSGWLK